MNPPEYFNARAVAMWRHVMEMKPVEPVDVPLLELLCASWSTIHWARETVENEGAVIPTVQGGKIPHPAIQIGKRATDSFCRIAHELGMTPKARKIKPKEPTKTIADMLE
jgi:P27 family predicted phage terminase small subunit